MTAYDGPLPSTFDEMKALVEEEEAVFGEEAADQLADELERRLRERAEALHEHAVELERFKAERA